jgi:hypothetical protein
MVAPCAGGGEWLSESSRLMSEPEALARAQAELKVARSHKRPMEAAGDVQLQSCMPGAPPADSATQPAPGTHAATRLSPSLIAPRPRGSATARLPHLFASSKRFAAVYPA